MTAAQARSSRPLRAAVGIVGGWIVLRITMLWPQAGIVEAVLPDRADAASPTIAAPLIEALPDKDVVMPLESPEHGRDGAQEKSAQRLLDNARHPAPMAKVRALDILPVANPGVGPGAQGLFALADKRSTRLPSVVARQVSRFEIQPAWASATAHDRLSVSGWILARGGGGQAGLAPSSSLGGSQAGVRVYYGPGPRGIAVTGRVTAPLSAQQGRDASVGVAIRQVIRHGSVGAIIEQRFALDGNRRSVPSVTVFGGVYDVNLPARIRLDGYVQAGVVGVRHPQAFADGAIRAERPVSPNIAIGAGVWGAAQPGAARLDIGPQIVAHIKVAGGSMRIAADWRERVAGNAAPGSGLTVSAGFDF